MQYREAAGSRSWAEAERVKRDTEDQLSGRIPETKHEGHRVQESIALFIQDKTVQGVTVDVLNNYKRELDRLRQYCEQHRVYTVQGITREVLTGFAGRGRRFTRAATHDPRSGNGSGDSFDTAMRRNGFRGSRPCPKSR